MKSKINVVIISIAIIGVLIVTGTLITSNNNNNNEILVTIGSLGDNIINGNAYIDKNALTIVYFLMFATVGMNCFS